MPHNRVGLRLLQRAAGEALFRSARFDDYWRVGFLGRDLLDPSSSRGHFGRWHNPTAMSALYFSAERSTAINELLHHLDPPYPDAIQAVRVTVTADRVLDLTAVDLPERLAYWRSRALVDTVRGFLRGAILGEAAFTLGATGLLASCLRGPGWCLCAFMNASPSPRIDVHERVILPLPIP